MLKGLLGFFEELNEESGFNLPSDYLAHMVFWIMLAAIGSIITIVGAILALIGVKIATTLMACGGIAHTTGMVSVIFSAYQNTK